MLFFIFRYRNTRFSFSCGFSDANYFTRCFKAHFKHPPTYYKNAENILSYDSLIRGCLTFLSETVPFFGYSFLVQRQQTAAESIVVTARIISLISVSSGDSKNVWATAENSTARRKNAPPDSFLIEVNNIAEMHISRTQSNIS